MKAVEFCYWLQGYFEIHGERKDQGLTDDQAKTVKQHLAMVFRHEIDPSYPKEQQADLNKIHSPPNTNQWPPNTPNTGPGPGNVVLRC